MAAQTLAPLVGVHVRGEPVRRAVPCMTSSERLRAWATKYPQVRVRHRVAGGGAVPALLGQAKTAGMLVVGPAGPGGIVRRLVHEAACPVLVACGASDRTVESVGARGEVRF